jgi:hypothetical protein
MTLKPRPPQVSRRPTQCLEMHVAVLSDQAIHRVPANGNIPLKSKVDWVWAGVA